MTVIDGDTILFEDSLEFPTEDCMEIHLVYDGLLLKAAGNGNTRKNEKHSIRKEFHKQLEQVWQTHPLLQFYGKPYHVEPGDDSFSMNSDVISYGPRFVTHERTSIASIAKQYEGYVPLVNEEFGMFCDLDILFLRPGPVGRLITRGAGGGDLDNRIKTLLDALSIPERGHVPIGKPDTEPDPSPIYVLMSDDSLITSIKVTAGTLLATSTTDPAEALVVVHATTKVVDHTRLPIGYAI